jgi:hypothetical protein
MNRIIDKNRKHAKRKLHIRKSISGLPADEDDSRFKSNLQCMSR